MDTATVTVRRRWDLVGLATGAVVGLTDVAVFAGFGARMEVAGYDVAWLTLFVFVSTYSLLGYAVGRLAMARTRAHDDTRTIRRQLAELEKAQHSIVEHEKLAAIGRLAAGIAHEVRNPLGVIRASAKHAQGSFAEDEDSYRACQFICEEIDRLDGLIASLLAFARPTKPSVVPIELSDVVGRALRLAADELAAREVSARSDLAGQLPVIRADADLLLQAILGLTLNAAQAVDRGGCIVVRADCERDGLRLDVSDDGPGVPEALADQIFEPFFTTKATGTGLGLAMASRIVEAHGGRIELIANAGVGRGGRGACFRIHLPLDGAAEGEAAA